MLWECYVDCKWFRLWRASREILEYWKWYNHTFKWTEKNFKTNNLTDELKFTKPPLPHHKLISFKIFFSSHGQLKRLSIFDQSYDRQIAWFNIYPWALKEFNSLFFCKLIGHANGFRQLQHLIIKGRKLLQFKMLQFPLTDKRDVFLHRRVWLRNNLYFCNVARLLSVF